jgi:hypothetical protein
MRWTVQGHLTDDQRAEEPEQSSQQHLLCGPARLFIPSHGQRPYSTGIVEQT